MIPWLEFALLAVFGFEVYESWRLDRPARVFAFTLAVGFIVASIIDKSV